MYRIVTDTSANLPVRWLKEKDVPVVPFSLTFGDRTYACIDPEDFDSDSMYEAQAHGQQVTTSQITPGLFMDSWRPYLERGEDLLFVSMSSGISGSYSSSVTAATELREEFPDRSIRTVDTLGASLGEGLLVMAAVEYREQGMGLDECAEALMKLRDRMFQIFMVGDLMHLYRGGRLSGAGAAVGTVLNIKPLLKGDWEGKIVQHHKVRGNRKAIESLARCYDERVLDAPGQTVGVAYTTAKEDAEYLCSLLRQKHPPMNILTVRYEPVTGSHLGPGSLALFFFGPKGVRET